MKTHLRLLGGPTLRLDGAQRTLPITRPVLLSSYLAYREAWVDRGELTALFWADTRESKARQSLRALLYRAKREPHGHALEVEPERVRWMVDTDVRAFVRAVDVGDWRAAVDTYAGTFLERVPGDDSAAFEAWLEQTRDELRRDWRDATLHVADDLCAAGRTGDALALLDRLLVCDLLDEEAVQACMRVHATAGDRARALDVYGAFRERLAVELEMAPLASTLDLAATIRDEGARAPARTPGRRGTVFLAPAAVPRPLTPFVGRRLELLELANLLIDPDTRLITLLGPGGVGKSRLSLQLLEAHKHEFEDGAVFVPLEALEAATDVPNALAAALGLERMGVGSVADEVCDHLRTRAMLVVLDNVEHVLGGAAGFVRRLLTAAPRCTVVCTSRFVLGLASEVVYDVVGLTVPSSPSDRDVATYDAVRFFVESARRAHSEFTVREADQADLVRLCLLLDGVPLALELAASWVRLYRLSDLADALERDIDLLESAEREASDRHRSLRAVFERSGRLLDTEERRALGALATFHGGFTREAAAAVAHASAKTLLALINKSLVRRTSSGRFSLLMVVRQYAREMSTSTHLDRERHAVHYLGFVERTNNALGGPSPTEALTDLHQDLDNIRAAWRWACGVGRFDLCDGVLEPFNRFFTGRALLQEGSALLEFALDGLGARSEPRFRARLHHQLAYFARRLDRHATAGGHARAALRLVQDRPDAHELAIDCLCELAVTSCWRGRFAEGAACAERALARAEELDDPDRIAHASSRLALLRRYQGRFDEASRLYQEVLGYERRLGRRISLARALSDVGRLWIDLRRPREAEVLFREGLELAERHDLPYELGFMWEGLSQCSYLLGDHERAQQQAETALRCSEAVRDQMGIAIQCADLAKIMVRRDQPERAWSYLKRALGIAWTRDEVPEVLKHFVTWATMPGEDPDRAATLLSWVVRHPGAQASSRRDALERLEEQRRSPLPVEPSTAALRRVVHGLLGTVS